MTVTEANTPSSELLGKSWADLEGEALFAHISAEGLNIPLTTPEQGAFVMESLHRKLNGYYRKVDVVLGWTEPTETMPAQFIARVALHNSDAESA